MTPAAIAAPATFRVLMDTDNSTATGCTVSGMDGVDQILVTTVEIGATTAAVTGTSLGHCGTATLTPITTSGWPAGYHAPSGRLLVETRIPLSMFQLASNSDLPRNMRIGIEATKGDQTQTTLTDSDGSVVLLPEPPHGRRRAVGPPGTPRTFTLDGLDTEWLPLDEKFDGVGSGGSFGLRILRAFAFVNTTDNFVYFLFDSNVSLDAPFADDDHHKRVPGQETLDIPAPGVLGNDVDNNTPPEPLTARPVSSPLHGTVIVNSDGSFTYTPENPSSRAADVFEYRANNGTKDSNTAKVKIKVGIGADDAYHGPAGTPVNVAAPGVLENDDNGNIDGLTATLLTEPSHGDVTLNPNGGFTYTPDSGFTGDDTFTYTVSGHGPSDTATVTITIDPKEQGQENQPPHVLKDKFKVDENAPAGTLVGKARVTDPNSGDTHTWTILSGNIGNAFAINPNTGQITVLTPSAINFETLSHYDLVVRATDNGTPSLSDAETIQIDVNNKNDAPVANPQSLVTTEGTPIPVTLTASDEDGNTLTYTVVVNPQHGVLTGSAPNLTYTPNAGFGGVDTFTFRANDGTANSNAATITITVRVVPTITSGNSANFQAGVASSFTVTTTGYPTPSISETGSLPAGITFHDNGNGTATLGGTAVQGSGGVYVITINASNVAGSATPQTFTITVCNNITVTNPGTATGTAGSPFSQTFTQSGAVGGATFTLASGTLPAGLTLATNGTLSGTPTQTGSFPITVRVTDANGCTGVSASYDLVIGCQTITVNNPANANGTASSPFSETFTQTGAIGGVTFTLASGTLPAGLTLASNGTLSGTPTQVGSFPITVTATDANGCSGTSATYTIVIGCQTITVTNPANANGTAASSFSETFTQAGAIGTATFTLASGTLPAGLTLASNGVLSGTPTQTGSFPITVTATDSNGCTGTGSTYTIVIGCQVINVTNPATTTGTVSAPFSQTFTQTGAIGTPLFTTASTLPAGLTLATNGTLSGTPTQTGSFPITVTVTDANGCTGTSATYTLVIGCQTITVTPPANANGTVSTPFSETFTQSGAVGGATFTLGSGTLPAGLTLAANGVLSGTPTQTGSFPITVTVTDGNGCTGTSATYTLVIACQSITVTNPATATGTAGSPFSQTFTQTGAIGTATFTTASTLPAGLTLSSAGVLSGTPTQTGSFPIVVTVTDSNGCTGSGATYTLVIGCQTITVNSPANANGTASSAFSETFTQTGAIGGATFSINSGTLPAGLTLAANGVLSGTPTQTGSFPITVKVTDGNGCTGVSATYTIVIACQTITVNNPATTTGTAATAFSQTFTQTGAIGSATFSINSGTLPAGLSLAANGVLSGTPTQTGSFPITVKVTDANGCTGISGTYTLTIGCQVINVTNPATTTGAVSAPFSQTFTQTGAIGTATFTTASTLPAGLTLSSAGVLSGTPTQTGSFPIVVTVTDSNGCTGNGATYTLVIGCQTITVTSPANANGTISTPFNETFTQSGSVGGATFSLNSGTLPAGLTLAANGVLSGTPTQSGSFPITVKVTDGNGCTGVSATYTIVIACQVITVTNPAVTTGPAGTPFSQTFTQTGAIGTATFTTASTLPTGLTLASNGVLSGTPSGSGTFPIVVTVTDSNGCTGTGATYNLTITCPTVTVTNPGTTTGTAGTAFSQTFTQSGGQGTITFTLNSGTLPAGLTLASNGTLSGTPTQTGSFPITVKATDQNGCSGTGATYTLVIACQTINVTNPATTTGTAASPFSQTFTQTGAIGSATFSINSGTLPAGLTLAANGVLSGTPTQTGSFPITVKVTDGNGCTGVGATYTLVIGCQTISVTNPATATGTLGVAFSQTFTQSGAIGTATFTTASTLPTGLTLSAAGVLSGTPSQPGSFPIVVTVTDSNGCTGTGATYTLVIACQTITVTAPANTSGTVGTPFNETFTQSGAVGTATFTLNTGTLPAGLTLSSAGVLSGTPTQSGSFPITVKVTDSNGCTGISATYTLVIACQVITVTNPATSTGTVDAAFSQTFTQTGAIGTATFTTSSTLPSGLTLSTAGVLSGTPGQPGSFPITVTVTDSNGCTGTSSTYTLVIACQTITVNVPGVSTGTVDAPFSQTFTQTGVGTHTPATFTTTSTLPSGLTLSTSGVLSGTPGQPGTFPITVKVTDVNGCSGTSATYTLVIACQTITVTNPGVTTATYNSAFTRNFTQVGVGTHTPATFTTSSTLPTGVTLSTAGVLSGTPTQTGTFPIVVTVTDANGCTGTGATYTLAVAPVANNDAISGAIDNVQLVLTGGATGTPGTPSVQVAGTIEVNDLPSAATVTVVSGTFATTGGGSVTIAADGTFLYTPGAHPAAAAITSDTFTYTVTSNTGGVAAVTSAPATVTITLAERVWFVKNDAAGGGNGQSQAPFNTLASAAAASTANDHIFVYAGDGATTNQNSGFVLKSGQRLYGQGIALVVNGSTLLAAGVQPQIGNSGGFGVSGTNLSGVDIQGLNIAGSTDAINFVTNGANSGGVNISNNTIRSAGTQGINIDGAGSGTLTISVHDNTLTASGNAIDISRTAGTVYITAFDDNTVTATSAASGIVVTGTGSQVIFDAVVGGGVQTVAGGTTNIGSAGAGNGVGTTGMVLNGVSGDLHFSNLNIYTDAGTGLFVLGGGAGMQFRVNSGGGNTGTIVAVGGSAVDVSTAALDLRLVLLTSTSSATTGVNLNTVTGTFSAPSGSTITNASGTDFSISAGTVDVTYSGTITDDVGQLVSIANSTGGTKQFLGAITDGDDGDGSGVSLTSNTGATIRFSGGLVLSTGANPAFTATGGGTVEVCAFNPCGSASAVTNKLTSTTGTTLNVANTTIGANDLTFRSIAANGAANGIVINSTGATGSLIVTGAGTASVGGDASGGTIQNTTGDGVMLTNTAGPSFTNVTIQNTGNSGVKGQQVSDFTFKNGTITGSGGAVFEGNLAFNEGRASGSTTVQASGTFTVTNNILNTAFDTGIEVSQLRGTISQATVTGNTLTSTTSTTTSKGSGIMFNINGDASGAAVLTKATIDNNDVANFPSGAGIKVIGGQGNAGGPNVQLGDPASGTNVITITNNDVHGQSAAVRLGTNAIETAVSPKGQGNFNISNNGTVGNPLTNVAGTGIALSCFGNSTVKAVINSNVIVANNTVNSSGMAVGADTGFGFTDAPDLTASITNNTISGAQGNGILAGHKSTNGTVRLTITGNNVAAPTVGNRPGIRVDSGTNLGGDTNVCLDIQNNTSAGSGGFPGIGVRKEGNVATTNDFGIEGLTPNPANPNQTEDYIGSANPASALGAAGFSNDGLRTVRAIVLSGTNYVSCNSAP